MSRVKRGVVARKRHKKILKQAKGFYGARSRTYRSAKQAVIKSLQYSYRDRRCKKREMRKRWILIINSALKDYNISYNKFIYNLLTLNIKLNRKMLHFLAIHHTDKFKMVVNNIINIK